MTRPEGRQSSRDRRMRACRRRGRRRLQRQRWHGCCCRYSVGSGGGRVHVGSVRGACAPAAAVVPDHGTSAARTAGDGAEAGRVGAGALTTNGVVKITSAAPDAAARSQTAASPIAPTTALPARLTMLLGAEAVVLAAEAWEARMQAVHLPHVAKGQPRRARGRAHEAATIEASARSPSRLAAAAARR